MNALPLIRKESWLRAVILSLALATAVEGGPDRGAGRIDFPLISLPGTQRGQEAINALGAQLPGVAQAYGMTADQLHLQLRIDPTLAVDPRGRLFFLEPIHEPAGSGAGPVEDPSTGIPTPPTLWLFDASGNPVMQIPTPPTRSVNEGASGQIPTPPTLWLYDAAGNPVMQIPTPPTRSAHEEASGQIPTPPTLWLYDAAGRPVMEIPTPPTLWLYDASGNPVMQIPTPPTRVSDEELQGGAFEQIPTPPTRSLNSNLVDPATQIPTPPTLWLFNVLGQPVIQIPTPPTRSVNGGSGYPVIEIPTPPTRVSDEELQGGAFEQIPTPPTRSLSSSLLDPSTQIPTPPTRWLFDAAGNPVMQIPTPPTRVSGEELQGGAFEQIPTPPTRSLSSSLLDPSTQIPTPPTRWLFDAAGNPVIQIPTPPTRMSGGELEGGAFEQIPTPPTRSLNTVVEDPATQIPTPPTRWLLDAAGNPVMQIPTPPTRSVNGGEEIPVIQIPTPPTRTLENGFGNPVIQIPTPPTRASNEPLLDFNSQQIPTPPTRSLNSTIGTPSTQIPTPPTRWSLDAAGNPVMGIPTPPTRSMNAALGDPSTQIPTPPTRQLNASEPVLFSSLVAPSTADALRLHSRPGAKRTLFLDFGGEVMANNVWTDNYNGGANIVAPAYDMDGDPTTFNETERSKIIEIWRRVAEDYAPFDVDVCTELTSEGLLTRSSISDDVYGVRVLFSPISRFVGNYGGVSYVGTFNDVGDYWKPSLVFTDTLGASNAKNLAEAASHEAGHALGLGHDGVSGGSAYYTGHGSGQTSWAPIMGVGYSRNVTQWSRGEYANANNREDDLQVMQSYGLGYRADDHGNTLAAASYLPVGTALYAEGLIERNTDVDVFAFNAGAGALSLTVAPQGQGPNLDVWAELRDASGIVVATANPGTALAATFNLTVPAGTYFLSVKGDSAPTPPSTGYPTYGSLGNYSVSGTVVTPSVSMEPVAVAEVSTVSGVAPLPVTFDGSRSFDPDGSLVSHEWNFGDGTRATGVAVSHSYAAAGVYTAVLTVTDNSGLSHSDLVEVTVSPAVQRVVRVASIGMSTTRSNAGTTAWARVRITDPAGNPVPGVSVTGRWTGLASSNRVAVTDAAGEALISSKTLKLSGTLNFAVRAVALSGYTYDASLNLETTDSVVITWP